MGIEGIFTIVLIILMLIALALEIMGTDIILFTTLAILLLSGIISPEEAFSGFANQGMITVGILFIISRAIRNTGALNNLALKILKNDPRKKKLPGLLLRMMIPVSAISAFLNNTPVVVLFVPMVKKWAEKINISPSKLLIPLSYAAIFGGVCTLIGTSTNLVVHGLMLENGLEGLTMFELAKVGIPCAIIGWIYLSLTGNKLLPDRKDTAYLVGENRKEYVVEMLVKKGCELIGQSIEEAGLRNLKGLYLLEIEREGKSIAPASPTEKIRLQDRLMFVGVTDAVVDLQKIVGLVSVAQDRFEQDFKSMQTNFIEAVISSSSPVIGNTIKEYNFRKRYGAGVVAVHRNGERIKSRIGDIKLKAGDTLLLISAEHFIHRWKDSQDFYLVSTVSSATPAAFNKAPIAIGILVLMVLTATLGRFLPKIGGVHINMLHAAMGALILLVLTGCIGLHQIKKAVRWDILITIACAFGISKGLQNSGAAEAVAGSMIKVVSYFGPVGVLAGVYLLTSVFTEIITNNAAAAFMFPIAYAAALKLNVDPHPFFIAIAIAASASFSTPIGYQTNLIVKGAGNYRFRDYFKIGIFLNLLFFVASIIIIPIFWEL